MVADTLSQMPLVMVEYMKQCTKEIDPVTLRALTNGTRIAEKDQMGYVASVGVHIDAVKQIDDSPCSSLPAIGSDEVRSARLQDPVIGDALKHKQQGTCPVFKRNAEMNKSVKQLHREWKNLIIDDQGILYRKTTSRNQLVLPSKY